MKTLVTLLFAFGLLHFNFAQCNGHNSLCSKTYNEVAYLTTHNAFNTAADGFNLPNQNNSITTQLNEGVRGFMLDVYNLFGTATVYHGSFVLGSSPLSDVLDEFKTFMDANPNEVVTIILECNVSASTIQYSLTDAGLFPMLYTHNGTWPTLQWMISNNKRLVIFSDVDDANVSQGWYHYMWDYMVETNYSINDINDFNCDYNRGDAANDLFIFNHFVTSSTTGTGQSAESQIANSNPFLIDRIQQCQAEKNKFPNFITLDFYELGDGMEATNIINGLNPLNIYDLNGALPITIYPNPFSGILNIEGNEINAFDVKLYNVVGVCVNEKVVLQKENNYYRIATENIANGVYFLQVKDAIYKVIKE